MAGQPQPREAGRLYGPDDRDVAIAMVRLEEHQDGSGVWTLLVNIPATAATSRVEFPDEKRARAALAAVYEWGDRRGEWEIREHERY